MISRHEVIDLGHLARTTVEAAPARVPVSVHTDEGVEVTGDPDQLVRVIRNILDNAQRYAHQSIDVTVSTHEGYAVLTVADDGPGVPPQDRERIFDRFVRLQTARTRHPRDTTGTGLGLPIARDIAAAHHGTLTVRPTRADADADADQAQQDPGATFQVSLPLR